MVQRGEIVVKGIRAALASLLVAAVTLMTPRSAAAQITPPFTTSAPQSCYDAFLRFQYTGDVDARWREGMREAGYNPAFAGANPFISLMLKRAPQGIGSWVAISLMRNRQGYVAPTLGQWIQEGTVTTFRLSPEDWNEFASWEPEGCEGSFARNPDNYPLMWLVKGLVRTS